MSEIIQDWKYNSYVPGRHISPIRQSYGQPKQTQLPLQGV
jgi:hypothetical protein